MLIVLGGKQEIFYANCFGGGGVENEKIISEEKLLILEDKYFKNM